MKSYLIKLVCFIFAGVLSAAALIMPAACLETDSTEYYIDELVMTIDIPLSVNVVSSNVKKSDPLFYDGTLDYIETMTKMRDDGALLYGREVSGKYELEIIGGANSDGIKDLSVLSAKKQGVVFADYTSKENVSDSGTYHSGDTMFFYLAARKSEGAKKYYIKEYYTVSSGCDIKVRMISLNDELSKDEETILKNIVRSISVPQKVRLTFSTLPGRSVLVTFIILSAAFVLVFFYRRHEPVVNERAGKAAAFVRSKLNNAYEKRGKKTSHGEGAVSDTVTGDTNFGGDHASDNTQVSKKDEELDDDLDLSDIDLDEAIAAFDDRRS